MYGLRDLKMIFSQPGRKKGCSTPHMFFNVLSGLFSFVQIGGNWFKRSFELVAFLYSFRGGKSELNYFLFLLKFRFWYFQYKIECFAWVVQSARFSIRNLFVGDANTWEFISNKWFGWLILAGNFYLIFYVREGEVITSMLHLFCRLSVYPRALVISESIIPNKSETFHDIPTHSISVTHIPTPNEYPDSKKKRFSD